MSVETTKAVRTILVKSWLDMGKIKIQVAGKTVIIRGRLTKSRADDDPVNGMFIEQLEQKISNLKEVKFIRWSLDDWKHERGQWRTKES
jgi:hypothetical protein